MIRFFLGMAFGAVLVALALWAAPHRKPWECALAMIGAAGASAVFAWRYPLKRREPEVHLHDGPPCNVTETSDAQGGRRFDIVFDPPLGRTVGFRNFRPR